MKTPMPELRPAEGRRLERVFKHILPKSYSFEKAFRRTVADLELFRANHEAQDYPGGSAEAFLLHVVSQDAFVFFQLSDSDSVLRRAHSESKSLQARAASSATDRGSNGQFKPRM